MKILISMVQLGIGGTERALMGLLKAFDRPGIDVTLLMEDLNTNGWEDQIPKNVRFKRLESKFLLGNAFLSAAQPYRSAGRKYLLKKLKKTLTIVLGHLHIQFESRYRFALRFFDEDNTFYDLALDFYGYGSFGTAYLAEKVKAKKKATWIHSITLTGCNRTSGFFQNYNRIYCVSRAAYNEFVSQYQQYEDKTELLYNYLDTDSIVRLSSDPIVDPDFYGEKIIVSVGRLAQEKGYDISIRAARILKDEGIKFRWFLIGEGPERSALQGLIDQLKLQNFIVLMGAKKNPMPYIKKADLYVQSSRNEGFGLTVAEALVLGKTVIASNIESFREQIDDGANGFIVENTPEAMAQCIMQIISAGIPPAKPGLYPGIYSLETIFETICGK